MINQMCSAQTSQSRIHVNRNKALTLAHTQTIFYTSD